MGKPKEPRHVKLVIGMLAENKKLFDDIEEFFTNEFGEIDYRSPVLEFDYTEYYKKEIGHPLKRKFISFKKLISPEHLVSIKLTANAIEDKFSKKKDSRPARRINIDPGYLSDCKFVLATTKDYSHRIYLDKGIYAEITLCWQRDAFQSLPWTYPDYRSKEYISALNAVRALYMETRGRDAG